MRGDGFNNEGSLSSSLIERTTELYEVEREAIDALLHWAGILAFSFGWHLQHTCILHSFGGRGKSLNIWIWIWDCVGWNGGGLMVIWVVCCISLHFGFVGIARRLKYVIVIS